jgi:hypothetical protein
VPVVRLANGLVERPVVDVIEPAAVHRAGRDGRRVPVRHEPGEEVVRLLPVRHAREGAVLALEEHAREDEHVQQKARVALAEAQVHERLDPTGTDALARVRGDDQLQKNSSATRGSNDRPPRPRLTPLRP